MSNAAEVSSDGMVASLKKTHSSLARKGTNTDSKTAVHHYNHLNEQSIMFQRSELIAVLNYCRNNDQIVIKARPKVNSKLNIPLHDLITQKAGSIEERKTEEFRGSMYRGVSKNKMKWQMMIMGNQKKIYIGAVESEMEAAAIYDKVSIIIHGIKVSQNLKLSHLHIHSLYSLNIVLIQCVQAKTNFSYSKQQIEEILAQPSTSLIDGQIKSPDKDIINL